MKFSIGYQTPSDNGESFVNIVKDYHEHIAEVYFSWVGSPSGRPPVGLRDGFYDWDAQRQIESELKIIRDMGIRLTLLLNANCHGAAAISQHHANFVISMVEHISETVGLDGVTTASPMIAHVIKKNFEKLELKASVNMRIGTVKGMEYLADLYDNFCIQRDYNRDIERIAELKDWADKNGKKLSLLANSGCLQFCSGQTFHDNLVAHEKEISGQQNISEWNPHLCWRYLSQKSNWVSLLQNTWIRPEDIDHYAPFFTVIKLATRTNSNPRGIIGAYARRLYHGNLLNLLEPCHASLLSPYLISNQEFPQNWFERTSQCNKKCSRCTYCQSVLEKVLLNQV